MVALCSEKISLAIVYNFFFMIFIIASRVVVKMFLGTLREVEVTGGSILDGPLCASKYRKCAPSG